MLLLLSLLLWVGELLNEEVYTVNITTLDDCLDEDDNITKDVADIVSDLLTNIEDIQDLYDNGAKGTSKYCTSMTVEERIVDYEKVLGKTEVTNALKSKGKSPAAVLRAELYAAGVMPPNYMNRAHHIVPYKDGRCKEARKILEEVYGIELNSAANGVFLPGAKGLENVTTEAVHSGGHLGKYYKEVDDRIVRIHEIIKDDATLTK